MRVLLLLNECERDSKDRKVGRKCTVHAAQQQNKILSILNIKNIDIVVGCHKYCKSFICFVRFILSFVWL